MKQNNLRFVKFGGGGGGCWDPVHSPSHNYSTYNASSFHLLFSIYLERFNSKEIHNLNIFSYWLIVGHFLHQKGGSRTHLLSLNLQDEACSTKH